MTPVFIHYFLKIFFIFTPFFVVSVFASLTKNLGAPEKNRIANKVTVAVMISSLIIFFAGETIFELFSITLDAFRIGAGAVLFLSALSMINGRSDVSADHGQEIAVVPLAMPITVGPGVIGVLMVIGAEVNSTQERITVALSLFCAVIAVGLLLRLSNRARFLNRPEVQVILTKVTGLFVSAIAAQIFFTGVRNFMV
ncbi:MarC family protein [Aestuariirhabdus sp. Z084]|uniref:MarC family protein n=1 Tax=Aestuariirhabdus haliotis TaxID=2918751 RepID=UPI00201B43D4|nr:MarC family protein [Aestuariirhabdus haliotis]MCL6416478.1 MarC family protein [Aestuariirhabdus haliotis]MCL6420468.1 MarC family protein [Aestuariirhabdus haliotis]